MYHFISFFFVSAAGLGASVFVEVDVLAAGVVAVVDVVAAGVVVEAWVVVAGTAVVPASSWLSTIFPFPFFM